MVDLYNKLYIKLSHFKKEKVSEKAYILNCILNCLGEKVKRQEALKGWSIVNCLSSYPITKEKDKKEKELIDLYHKLCARLFHSKRKGTYRVINYTSCAFKKGTRGLCEQPMLSWPRHSSHLQLCELGLRSRSPIFWLGLTFIEH